MVKKPTAAGSSKIGGAGKLTKSSGSGAGKAKSKASGAGKAKSKALGSDAEISK